MKTIKCTDLNGSNAYINQTALLKVAQIAMGKAHKDLVETLNGVYHLRENGKSALSSVTIEQAKRDMESFALANELVFALSETNGGKRQLHIVRDDIEISEGFHLIGQYDRVQTEDLFFNDVNCQWENVQGKHIGQYSLDLIVIRANQ